MSLPPAVPAMQMYPLPDGTADGRPSAEGAACCAYFDLLFEHAPVGALVLDLSDRVLRANPAFCRLFGYSVEQLVGHSVIDLIVPDFLHHEAHHQLRQALQGHSGPTQTVRRRRDGSHLDVSLIRVAVQVGGEPVAQLALYQDTSEAKLHAAERHELLVRERRESHASHPAPERRARILTTVRALLHGDGTPEAILSRLARFLVPELADSCIVYLRDAVGVVRRVDVAFADPEQESLLREQLTHYPPELPRLIPPVARALNTGEAQLLPEVSIGALKAVPGDREHVSVALLVGLSSLLVVPLIHRGHTLGAISLGTADSGRHYHADDLLLCEEIARFAALAIAPRMESPVGP